jgi:hypothetical protein
MKIVATLVAGVNGGVGCGLDETGKVYVLDEKGKPLKEAPEPIAKEVREAIKRGKEAGRAKG